MHRTSLLTHRLERLEAVLYRRGLVGGVEQKELDTLDTKPIQTPSEGVRNEARVEPLVTPAKDAGATFVVIFKDFVIAGSRSAIHWPMIRSLAPEA